MTIAHPRSPLMDRLRKINAVRAAFLHFAPADRRFEPSDWEFVGVALNMNIEPSAIGRALAIYDQQHAKA